MNQTPSGEIVSGLAESWDATATGATFTLRTDVTCSDGTPLDVEQAAAALLWVGDPEKQAWLCGFHPPTTPYTVEADAAASTVSVPIVCASRMADRTSLRAGFGRGWGDGYFSRTATPALSVPDFNMSSVSPAI